MGNGAEGLNFEITYGSNVGVEETKYDVDPGRLGMDGAERVGGRVDKVVERTTSSRHLDACRCRVIVPNPINCLGDEGVEGLVVSHKFAGLAFARVNGGANDCLRVKHRTGLEGSNRRCELRDGKGLAGEESLT